MKPRLWGAARWLIWAAAGFVFLRGFVSLLPSPKAAAGPAPATVPAAAPDQSARSFAALFVHEYLAYQPAAVAERAARLEPYLAPGGDRTGGLDVSHTARGQTVTQAWPWRTESRGEGRWTVTVVAQVQDAPNGKETPPPRYLALAVPVTAWKGGFAVSAYPAFVPVPLDKPGLAAEDTAPGAPLSDPDPTVRDLLLGFLKAYAGGTPAEIRYFLLPGVELPGLGGQFAFQELTGFQLRQDGQRYWATADALLRDPVTNADYRQRLVLELEKRERWYIKDILQKGGAAQ